MTGMTHYVGDDCPGGHDLRAGEIAGALGEGSEPVLVLEPSAVLDIGAKSYAAGKREGMSRAIETLRPWLAHAGWLVSRYPACNATPCACGLAEALAEMEASDVL